MHTLTHKFSLTQGLVHTASTNVDTQHESNNITGL